MCKTAMQLKHWHAAQLLAWLENALNGGANALPGKRLSGWVSVVGLSQLHTATRVPAGASASWVQVLKRKRAPRQKGGCLAESQPHGALPLLSA